MKLSFHDFHNKGVHQSRNDLQDHFRFERRLAADISYALLHQWKRSLGMRIADN